MKCPYCGEMVPGQSQFCPNCGTRLPAESVQPYDSRQTPVPQQTAPRPVQPVLGMIFGIIGAILSIVVYVVMLEGAVTGGEPTAGSILLVVPALGAAVIGLIFSIIGMRRSVRTGGRKYVAGIVFSAVGIACSAFALIYLLVTVALFNIIRATTYRHYGYY